MKTTNKYGKEVYLPDIKDTKPELMIEGILKELDVNYRKQFFFDIKGIRNKKFDFAVFNDDGLAYLIEFDGPPHYSADFYIQSGNREERARCHVARTMILAAEKDRIANERNAPLLRINYLQIEELRSLIKAYTWVFIDNAQESAKEISMVQMFDKYGWDFNYVKPSEMSKKEEAFLTERDSL